MNPMRAAILLAAPALLAACGERAPEPTPAELANTIERIAEQRSPKAGPLPMPALVPLAPGDVERALPAGAGCDFSIGDRLLFVATGGAAAARVNGRIVRFTTAAPLGPTGGFFEGGGFAISVGRMGEAGVTVGETVSWPARLSLADRTRDEAQIAIEGAWRCRQGSEGSESSGPE